MIRRGERRSAARPAAHGESGSAARAQAYRLLLSALLVLSCSLMVAGQSGRRGQKPAGATTEQSPQAQASSGGQSAAAVGAPKLTLFVADHFDSTLVSSGRAREIFQGFVARLREQSGIAVTSERDVSR
ncbi:MAG TPA: hypothetical protein VF507_05270 [Pyrinomonadaceae bacterium]